ncbi:DUF4097 family beta strand repeat-containing protein [Dictyobacter arantiisoli]|uniref:DUF4097 domain-containing protein n=1 Tax=Dictyobacter arantiisoli TaxID=2014874 RepID=A0A5A5T6S0_9CHLR|nr:DUF4097 family beta strand repeat-containing protein [Dictyobacter arantiisoli]GCF06669.1 hypothetical protein KDI_02330 [Dictyobacter arantiisoli]
MQSQEGDYHPQYQYEPEHVSTEERVENTDPREHRQQADSPSYTDSEFTFNYQDGYSGQIFEEDSWFREDKGAKLRPRSEPQRGSGNILLLLGILLIGFVLGEVATQFIGITIAWLIWIPIALLVAAGIFVVISNWRVVVAPLPVQTFPIQEHARLVIDNFAGNISVRRGEQSMVTLAPTTHASGLGNLSNAIKVNAYQQGDNVSIASMVPRLLFGFRRADLVITVPEQCDIQLKNGSGKVSIKNLTGEIKVHTGSGSIEAAALQGSLALKTGSGSVDVAHLQGQIAIKTGSGSMQATQLDGSILLSTGSGPIVVDGLRGQSQFTTGSGRIEALSAQLKGNSTFKTGSGSISFSGTLDSFGDYRLKTGSGHINFILASQTAFNLKAATGSGRIINEFGSDEVGTGPRAQLSAKTGSGGITIQRGQ